MRYNDSWIILIALSYSCAFPGSFELIINSSRGTDERRMASPTIPSFI